MRVNSKSKFESRGRPFKRLYFVPFVLLASMLGLATVAASTHESAGNLPAGTSIEVSIDSPASGTSYFVTPGGTVDVTVSGTAAVGAGDPIKDTTVVYILDRSGSMSLGAGVNCDGNAGNDSYFICQREAVRAANAASAAANSNVFQEGVGSYAANSTAHNVDLAPGGDAKLVAPDYDGNGNGTHDIVDVAGSLTLGGLTCFECGLEAAETILVESTTSTNLVIFISDGVSNAGNVNNFDAGTLPPGTIIQSFAMGAGSSCTGGSGGTLTQVAAIGNGTCTQVLNPADLAGVIGTAVGSQLVSLEITVDGGAASTIANADISLDLPQAGPVGVTYSTEATGLGAGTHEICVTANGTDAGGAGDVTACVTIHVVELVLDGQMTGGGSVFDADDARVTHGFTLHCDAAMNPQQLQVNWAGQRFHLQEVTNVMCYEDGAIDATPPVAPFNTQEGAGTGRLNNVPGATIEWKFTDAGQPGSDDTVSIKIWDADSNLVLDVTGLLDRGNHQAHGQ